MRIACPNCAAEYDLPDAMLAGGRRQLRCARCGHRFEATPPGAAAPPAPLEAATPRPVDPPPDAPMAAPVAVGDVFTPDPLAPWPDERANPTATAEPQRPPPVRDAGHPAPIEPLAVPDAAPRGGPAMAAAWLLSFALLGAAGWAALQFRAEVMQAWPPAIRLYAALGLG
jgi:predicted Zn finger-like uncharacterized protein